MKNNIAIVLVLVILAAGGIWYVSSSGSTPADTMLPVPTVAQDASGSSTMMEDSNVKEVTIEGTEFKFVADTLTVKKGEKVRLTFKNTGEMKHDWVVDELGVSTEILESGKQEIIEFTPDKAGVFEYYCSVGEHRKNGMVGTITVEE